MIGVLGASGLAVAPFDLGHATTYSTLLLNYVGTQVLGQDPSLISPHITTPSDQSNNDSHNAR